MAQIEVSAFLAKPFAVEDLLNLVERLIGKADHAREKGQGSED
jgi:hypothetical protein